jgi:hypothetical protein
MPDTAFSDRRRLCRSAARDFFSVRRVSRRHPRVRVPSAAARFRDMNGTSYDRDRTSRRDGIIPNHRFFYTHTRRTQNGFDSRVSSRAAARSAAASIFTRRRVTEIMTANAARARFFTESNDSRRGPAARRRSTRARPGTRQKIERSRVPYGPCPPCGLDLANGHRRSTSSTPSAIPQKIENTRPVP